MNIDFSRALEWLTTHFSPIHNTTRTYGFALKDGRQIAIKPLQTQITVFAEPGAWELSAQPEWKLRKYSSTEGRSSNLKNCAPRLEVGYPTVSLALKSYEDFETFIEGYVATVSTGVA
ncbi:hypothetical protein [Pusillimonas noertemannii]|uniref:hypothetical protein n=1 Tax=Pusillimonas noertemannii TaxID=305977 RepID=UPI0012FD2BB8|nr:hypothetical protein [Pusillimonas noertemannii]